MTSVFACALRMRYAEFCPTWGVGSSGAGAVDPGLAPWGFGYWAPVPGLAPWALDGRTLDGRGASGRLRSGVGANHIRPSATGSGSGSGSGFRCRGAQGCEERAVGKPEAAFPARTTRTTRTRTGRGEGAAAEGFTTATRETWGVGSSGAGTANRLRYGRM